VLVSCIISMTSRPPCPLDEDPKCPNGSVEDNPCPHYNGSRSVELQAVVADDWRGASPTHKSHFRGRCS
jgi:hypothetical protein